jgi:D-alanyl-D-alanine carboxypeptidase
MARRQRQLMNKLREGSMWIAIGLVLAVCFNSACGEENVPRKIDQYIRSRVGLGQFNGVILVAKGRRLIFRRAYGYADVDRKIRYTHTTPQYIASLSKMFTDMVILRLRDKGKLSLQDSVCAHLDDCPPAWRPITIEQLMRHTSGIPDYEEKLGLFSPAYLSFMREPGAGARILESAKKLPLDFKPGEQFHYSNTGYVVLGYVAQQVAGRPFGELLVNDLLKPAAMSHSGVSGYGARPANMAKGYTTKDWSWKRVIEGMILDASSIEERPMLPLTPPEGDAGLYSTVDDLLRWSLVMDGTGVIPAADIAEALTPGLGNYGYGWRIDEEYGQRRLGHNGGLPGYISALVKYPSAKITIIILCNLDTVPLRRTSRDIAAIVLGKPYDLPVKGPVIALGDADRRRFAGQYRFDDGSILTVSAGPQALSAEVKGQFTVDLLPRSATDFIAPELDGTLTFRIDHEGFVTTVTLHYNGEDHVAVPVTSRQPLRWPGLNPEWRLMQFGVCCRKELPREEIQYQSSAAPQAGKVRELGFRAALPISGSEL